MSTTMEFLRRGKALVLIGNRSVVFFAGMTARVVSEVSEDGIDIGNHPTAGCKCSS